MNVKELSTYILKSYEESDSIGDKIDMQMMLTNVLTQVVNSIYYKDEANSKDMYNKILHTFLNEFAVLFQVLDITESILNGEILLNKLKKE